MEILEAVLLGAVQGLAEFFPISSSGLIFLLGQRLGIPADALPLFALFLHAGTMFAVPVVLEHDARRLGRDFRSAAADGLTNARIFITGSTEKYKSPVRTTYRKLSILLFLATLFAGALGLVLLVPSVRISGSSLYTGVGFILNGIFMLILSRIRMEQIRIKEIPLRYSLLIGAAGGAAVIPGLSFVGLVCGAGILSGLSLKAALRFSYLLSASCAAGALLFGLVYYGRQGALTGSFFAGALPGAAAAFFIGMLLLRRAQAAVRRHGFLRFAVLSFAAGGIAAVLYLA